MVSRDIRRLYYEDHPSGCNCGCSGHRIINLAAGEQPIEQIIDIDKIFNRAIQRIYEQHGGTQQLVEKDLYQISNRILGQGVGKTFAAAGVKFGKENADFINQFSTNARVFAAFKNHQQTKEIVSQLIGPDGKLRSFSQFKKEALKISEDYNKVWLQTEYNTAVRSARMAANWIQFQRTKDLYPNLEYMPSVSADPRESHEMLYGIILPIDDPFWDENLPPSDWNCKCSVQAVDSDATDLPDDVPDVPLVFQNNPGKSADMINLVAHPYYTETEPGLREAIRKFAEEEE